MKILATLLALVSGQFLALANTDLLLAWEQPTESVYSSSAALGDIDGDGDLDCMLADNLATPLLFLNNGTGTFSQVATGGSNPQADLPRGHMSLFHDLDGDNDQDIVIGGAGFQILLNNGSGLFSATGVIHAQGAALYGLTVLDADGDGDFDIATPDDGNGDPGLWLNNGTASFTQSLVAFSSPAGPFDPKGVTAGDVDGDGDLDLAFSTGADDGLYLNNGSGVFTLSPSNLGGFAGVVDVDLADFDGDGDLDAWVSALSSSSTAQDEVWLNDGTGVFTLGSSYNSGATYQSAVVDADGDGDLDVVTGTGSSRPNRVWLNNGSASFVADSASHGTDAALGIAAGDLDGDGDADYVLAMGTGPFASI